MKNIYNNHIPVLLKETINALNLKKDGVYLDCTFGRGGHSFEILKNLSSKGKLICFDRDIEAVNFFKSKNKNDNCYIYNSSFSQIEKYLLEIKIFKVDGILYDLGVSSPQIDNVERGFSYIKNYRLDMRMNQNQEIDANYILKNYKYNDLYRVFYDYANDRNPKRICNKIIKFREENPNKDFFSEDLVKIIREGIDRKNLYKKYPEKKYFQAIRIEVNDEINEIKKSLDVAFRILNKGGRIVIISFNSLEDKIIKEIFYEKSKKNFPKEIPITENLQNFKIINNKYFTSNNIENSREKSSKIRCIERC